jgi:hypothetical protein
MLLVGFEPTISEFERAKAFHALDLVTTVISCVYFESSNFYDWLD